MTISSTYSPNNTDKPLVFLMVSHGWSVRNYLLSDFLANLLRQSRVVVCSPLAHDDEFRERLEYQGVNVTPLLHHNKSWLHKRISSRRTLYHFAWCGVESMEIKLARARSWYGPLANLRNRIDQELARQFTGPRLLRILDRLEVWCRMRSEQAKYYEKLFRKLQPALVFSTASVMQDEWLPLYVAKKMGVKTVTAVMSWDNLTSKSRLPYGADRYIVWTEQMKRDLLKFHSDVRDEQVLIGGTPQFDYHMDTALRVSRAEFCEELGLDPARKIIVYSGVTPGLMPYEPEVVAGLLEAVRSGNIAGHPQVLIRLHPVDDGERYENFREQYPEAVVFVPGEKAKGDECRLVTSIDDLEILINTLIHGDVHLNVASTITIDAAVLDRPVINIRYDVRPHGTARSSGMDLFECTHYRPVVASGGVRVAYSLKDAIEDTNAYLKDPSLDREGRKRIVEEICGPLDGRAGQRIAELMADFALDNSRRVDSKIETMKMVEAG